MSQFYEKEDFRNTCLASLISGTPAVAGAALYFQDKSSIEWVLNLKKPKWADYNSKAYMLMDIATSLPLGCASYLVYKHGGGFEYNDTKAALAVYGANMACTFYSIYAVKTKNLDMLFHSAVGLSGTAAVMFGLFHKESFLTSRCKEQEYQS